MSGVSLVSIPEQHANKGRANGKLTCSSRSSTATLPNSAAQLLQMPPTARVARQKTTASAFEGENAPTVSPGLIPKSLRSVWAMTRTSWYSSSNESWRVSDEERSERDCGSMSETSAR